MIVFIVLSFKSIPKVISVIRAHQLNVGDGVEEVGKGWSWVGEMVGVGEWLIRLNR